MVKVPSLVVTCATLLAALGLAHIGEAALLPAKASQLVTVKIGAGNCGGFPQVRFFDTLVTPDGNVAAFSIPTGSVLVVTAVEVEITGPLAAGADVRLDISSTGNVNVEEASDMAVTTDATTGRGNAHFLFPNGMVVKSGHSLCVVGNGATLFQAVMHGFIASDR